MLGTVLMATLFALACGQTRKPLAPDLAKPGPAPVPIMFDDATTAAPPAPVPIRFDDATTAAPPVPNATYWLAMSDKLRPGNPFGVSGAILKGSSSVSVTFVFMDREGKKEILRPAPVVMQPGAVMKFEFDVPLNISRPTDSEQRYWGGEQYKVMVSGEGEEVNFKKVAHVQYEEKAFSTFIQTDKGMYKPGQKVLFRVLTVFPDMTAVRGEKYDIFIEDANENRIRQWLGVEDPNGRGVIELSLQLADQIPTGDWTIHATILGKEETKTFTVDDYVLPRFEVEVMAPPFGLSSKSMMKFTVKATYTFGQPVTKGFAILRINSFYWGRLGKKQIRKRATLAENGMADFEVPTSEFMEMMKVEREYLTSLNHQEISVTAEVTETLTGRIQKSDPAVNVKFFDTDTKIRFVEEVAPHSFKPGLPYLIYAEVTKQDGSLHAQPNNIEVYFNVTYEVPLTDAEKEELKQKAEKEEQKHKQEEAETMSAADERVGGRLVPHYPKYYHQTTKRMMLSLPEDERIRSLPANGWVDLTFDAPKGASSITIDAWVFNDDRREIRRSKYLSEAKSPSNTFLQLHVGTEKPKVGQDFEVQAKSTDVIKHITYQIYAKGVLQESKIVENSQGSSNGIKFSFRVTRDMAPSISLVAFYVREENKEVVVDALSLSVNGLFDDPMTIQFSKDTAEPGDKLDLLVKAKSDSLVYLLSADKSAVLLKGGNDLTQNDVTQDMAEYTLGNFFPGWRFMFICGWPSPYSGNTAGDILRNAGVVFVSDVLVYSYQNFGGGNRFPSLGGGDLEANSGVDEDSADKESSFTAVENVRKFFPEVWLWEISYITDDSGGQVSIPVTVPDTLTSWMTTGFSIHPEFGLSIVEEPTVLTVSRDLFVTLALPMSLIRGENYCFTATVFSYYNGSLPVMVTLSKSDKFTNTHVRLDGEKITLNKGKVNYAYYLGDMMENEVRSVRYCFTPLELGEIPVKVSALTNVPGLSDAVERIVISKPEGVPRASTYAQIADLSATGQWDKELDIEIPPNTVEGSHSLIVSTSGNFLGSMFDNLGGLLKKPYGCGEQNMLNFAPNIFLLEFYKTTNNLPEDVKKTAIKYMLDGYQRQNTYRHKNGGYSTFGSWDSDDTPSTWLTAFVVKCYALAQQLYLTDSDLVAIDSDIVTGALTFLATTQQKDGSFVENGKIFHKEMQGASADKGVSITAYTVIAMHEAMLAFKTVQLVDDNDLKLEDFVNPIMTAAVSYLESKVGTLSDPYDINVIAYALKLADSPVAERAFQEMENAAQTNGNVKFWERASLSEKPKNAWSTNTASINIEMTSYALLVYSLRPDPASSGLPVLRWLTQNKGPNAGFYSTQDTIIGLQALSRVGSKLYTGEDIPVTVTVTYKDENEAAGEHVFNLNKDNELLLQTVQIPIMNTAAAIPIAISAKTVSGASGPTTAIVEATLHYNVLRSLDSSKFIVRHLLREATNNKGFTLHVTIAAPAGESRSMSVMEVEIPPGYYPDMEKLKTVSEISRVEMKEENLALYFNTDVIDFAGVKVRIDVEGSSTGRLTKPQERTIRVYDYYEPSEEVTRVYMLRAVNESTFCDAVPDVGVCSIVEMRKNNLA